MTDQTVIAFPIREKLPEPRRDFHAWISWVECELSILGFDLHEHDYDWRGAFDRGQRPDAAAAKAASLFEAS